MFHSGSQEAPFEDFHRKLCRLQWTAASADAWFLRTLATYSYHAAADFGLPLDLQHDITHNAWQQLNEGGHAVLCVYDASRGIPACRSWWVTRIRWACRNAAKSLWRQHREKSNAEFESVDLAGDDDSYQIRELLEQLESVNKSLRVYVELVLRGLSVNEIAHATNRSVEGVYKLRQAVIKILLSVER